MSYGMSIGGHLFQNDYGVTPSQKPVRWNRLVFFWISETCFKVKRNYHSCFSREILSPGNDTFFPRKGKRNIISKRGFWGGFLGGYTPSTFYFLNVSGSLPLQAGFFEADGPENFSERRVCPASWLMRDSSKSTEPWEMDDFCIDAPAPRGLYTRYCTGKKRWHASDADENFSSSWFITSSLWILKWYLTIFLGNMTCLRFLWRLKTSPWNFRKQHPSEARASSDTPRREVETTPMPLSARSARTPKALSRWEGKKTHHIVPSLCKPTFDVFCSFPLLARRYSFLKVSFGILVVIWCDFLEICIMWCWLKGWTLAEKQASF